MEPSAFPPWRGWRICYSVPVSHRLHVLIAEEMNTRLRKIAQRRRISKGELVRRAIEAELARATSRGSSGADPVSRLAAINAPTADIDQMIAEVEAGRE